MKDSLNLYGELCQVLELKNKDSEKLMKIIKKYHIGSFNKELNSLELLEKFTTNKYVEGNNKLTCNNRKNALKKFIKYTNKKVSKTTKDDVKKYLDYLRDNGGELSSIYIVLSHIRNFFNWAEEEGYISENPTKGIKYKLRVKPRKAIPEKDMNKLRNACKTQEERLIIEFLVNTGVRLNELCTIKLSDVNFNENTIIVFGKGSKTRTVLFNDYTKKLLKKSIKKCSDGIHLLCHDSKGKPVVYTRPLVSGIIKDIAERTDIEYSVHPHLFRHTFATNCLDKGMDLLSIQKLLGHSDVSTTQIYAETNIENVRKEYLKIFKWKDLELINYIVNYVHISNLRRV